MTPAEYARHDGIGLARLIGRGEVAVGEVLDACLAAIEATNPTLNAVVVRMDEAARRFAAALPNPLPASPLAGVPYLLKDLTLHYAGVPTTGAAPFRRDRRSDHDSELVRRLKAAGVVICGKTAVPEHAFNWSTESRLYGPTRNPWSLGHSTGTSSGGAAAAVAAGMAPLAHGNDAGGSIRVPASCCGVFGLKPSRGRTPTGPRAGDLWQGILVNHAITRSVRDSAALLDVTDGQELGAFFNAPPKPRPYLDELERTPGRLRIAVSTEAPYGAPTHPDCLAAVADAVALCEALGHYVEPATPPLPEHGWDAFSTFFFSELAVDMAAEERQLGRPLEPADVEPVIWEALERGRGFSAVEQGLALRVLHQIAREHGHFFERFDVLLTPTLAVPPVELGHFDMAASLDAHMAAYLGFMPFTHPFNIAGLPAMSVPLYWNAAGLPVGVQFAAGFAAEATLFRLAAQLEEARPWADRWPPVHCRGANSAEASRREG